MLIPVNRTRCSFESPELDTERATTLVDALVEREMPLIWEVMGRKRVLRPGLSMRNKTLLLLYSSTDPVSEGALAQWGIDVRHVSNRLTSSRGRLSAGK